MPPTTSTLAHVTVGDGARLVLIHGFTQSRASWRTITRALAPKYQVCAVDLPGHGESGEILAGDLSESAALVAGVGGVATYIGYSLGGRVALTLALARPELVERLVLVGATAGIADDGERTERRRSDDAIADRLDPPGDTPLPLGAFFDEWLTQPLFAHLTPEQHDLPSRIVNTNAGLARSLRTNGTGTQTPSFDRLGTLEMPVLLVVGEHDTKFTSIAESMARAIGANATVASISDSGHAVPFEQPARFVEAVTEWLADEV